MESQTSNAAPSLAGVRVAFMGTPEFAVASLAALRAAQATICCVVTPPDRPAGRGLKLRYSAVKAYALEHGLPLLQPSSLNDPTFLDALRDAMPDVGVVVAFRKLPQAAWSLPRLGTFNLHASLLPQYRGAAPIPRAVMNGDEVSGVTTFLLDEHIDTGAILLRSPVPIGANDTAGDLHDRLMDVGSELVLRTVRGLAQGSLSPMPQAQEAALRRAPKIFREDCRINWQASALRIHNHVRGLSPLPGAWCAMQRGDNQMEVKLFDSLVTPLPPEGLAGPLCFSDDGKRMLVRCGDQAQCVSFGAIQLPGKRRMLIEEFRRGLHAGEAIHLN